MAKTVHMGLNTEPTFKLPPSLETFSEEQQTWWKKEVDYANSLKDEIEKVMAEDGECSLSWSCTGRTRHEMHASQWARALPQYDFEIGYNYVCNLTTKGAK